MQTQASIFDELAKLMTGAMGVATGVQEEARSLLRAQADRLVAELDLVGREEFEAMKALAQSARAEADALRTRLEQLEARVSGGA